MRYKGRFSYLLSCSHTILFILLHVELYTLYVYHFFIKRFIKYLLI